MRTVRFQLQFGLVCIAVAVAGTGLMAGLAMRDLVGGFSEAYGELSDETLALQTLRSSVLVVDAEATQLATTRSAESRRRLALAVQEVDAGFAGLDDESLTEEGAAVQRAGSLWQRARGDLDLLGEGPPAGSAGVAVPSRALLDAAGQLEAARDQSVVDAEFELRAAREEYRSAVLTMAGLTGVVLLMLLLGRRILVRSMLAPLAELGATASRLGAGDLSTRTAVAGGAELRELAAAFNAMATEVEETHTELARGALRDPLTGLGNRRFILDRLDVLGSARANFAVMVVDLDGFKAANDTGGHAAGDVLLLAVAERLRQVVRGGDVIARLGGDEFIVIARSGKQSDAEALAERLIQALSAPHDVDGRRYTVSASVGIAIPAGASSTEDLLGDADMAMYAAKQAGGAQWAVYEASMRAKEMERLDLVEDLRGAVERDELEVHYQPIVDVITGSVDKLEALVRWRHPARGLVPPDGFIAWAEQANLIAAIGDHVLRQACSDAVRFSVRSGRPISVSVNVSPYQLRLGEQFVEAVTTALAESGLPPSRLTVEITENVLLDLGTAGAAVATLQQLRRLGVTASIDDFGTGHSSLARLRDLPVDELKIDRSFISDTAQRHVTEPMVAAIATMADLLGLTVVAEGVEDEQQRQAVAAHGCQRAQGYLFSRPVPAEEVAALLDADSFGELAAVDVLDDEQRTLASALRTILDAAPDAAAAIGPMLAVLQTHTGYEAAYITTIDWNDATQSVRYAHNHGEPLVAPGPPIPFDDTLCIPMLAHGPWATDDTARDFPDSTAAAAAGIAAYCGVPIHSRAGEVVGTVCVAGRHSMRPQRWVRQLMEMFADIVADHVTDVCNSCSAAIAPATTATQPRALTRARSSPEAGVEQSGGASWRTASVLPTQSGRAAHVDGPVT